MRRGFQPWLLATAPLFLAAAFVAGQAQAAAPAAQSNTKGTAKTSQSAKSAARPAKTAVASKQAASIKSVAPVRTNSKSAAAQKGTRTAGKRLQAGKASWYGPGFHGRKTANGERFNMYELTAAHRTLPLGTRVRVVNPDNGKEVVVRINDRGPYAHGRILDLSQAAASKLGMIQRGHGEVVLHALGDVAMPDGQGLSTTRVAANNAESTVGSAQSPQAEVLARTRFGDSKQILGSQPEAYAAANERRFESDSARIVPAEGMPVMGLAASQHGLGFDVSRASSMPWGRTEWERAALTQTAQSTTHAPEAGLDAVQPTASAVAAAPAGASSASAALASAVLAVAGGSVVSVPTESRLGVPETLVLPVQHVPEEATRPDLWGSDSAHEVNN